MQRPFFKQRIRVDRNGNSDGLIFGGLLIYPVRAGLPDKDKSVFFEYPADFFAAQRRDLIH